MDAHEIVAVANPKNTETPKFWKALEILLENPHLINRRISVSTEIILAQMICEKSEILEWLQSQKSLISSSDVLACLNSDKKRCDPNTINSFEQDGKICLRFAKLIPRNSAKYATTIEAAVIDKDRDRVDFFYHRPDPEKRSLGVDFTLQRSENGAVKLSVDAKERSSFSWLEEHLLNKFVKWIDNDAPGNFLTGSLKLVPLEKYAFKYEELKRKYGTGMVEIWPEITDPAKFVYEDVAIATYLLLLWEEERAAGGGKMQSFVDLGCGNGLLVHILMGEGHPGLGIDLRKRKIWDFFPDSTKLEVRTIIPSSSSLFSETDWIIGNHSDELTPWVPVIAARSSYSCRFFLLPCCAFEFDGRKYQRNQASLSQYAEYMDYVRSVSEACGFVTRVDKLRIPSTKRVCFVGVARDYPPESHSAQEERIQEIIRARNPETPGNNGEGQEWANFKPREVVEKVRNCTRLDKSLISDVIGIVASHLLRERRMVKVFREGKEELWNAGRTEGLGELAGLLGSEMLGQMKKECGGLQTLLKNNGHVFLVEKGRVGLRNFGDSRGKRRKVEKRFLKTRDCWFHDNHPDGCPVAGKDCCYRHDGEGV